MLFVPGLPDDVVCFVAGLGGLDVEKMTVGVVAWVYRNRIRDALTA